MDVVVSPHFDDAAFSAAHVLVAGGAEVTVLTVCAGAPDGAAVSEWDLRCGFASGAAAAAGRAREDDRANAIAGVASVRLAVSDAPYREVFPHERVAAELAAVLPAAGAVWVPAGLGGHPDHVGTREAVLAVVPAGSGRVRCYADCPYAFAFGWDAADAERGVSHRWERHLARLARYFGTARPQPHTVRLGPEAMRVKLAMLSCHESQLRAMAPEFAGLLDADGPLRRETYWTAQVTAGAPVLPGAGQAAAGQVADGGR